MEIDIRSRGDGEPFVRSYDDADPPMIVMDLGERAEDVQTDVVGETLILVDESHGEQYELSLPSPELRTFMRNGILTIEVEE